MITVVLGWTGSAEGLPFEVIDRRDSHRLARRIRTGVVSLVVLVVPGLHHRESIPVIAACRSTGTPFRLLQRAGRSHLLRVLNQQQAERTAS